MSETVSEEKAKVVYAFLEKNVTPRFQKIIEEVNKYLEGKHGVRVGADLNWLIDKAEKKD